MWPNLTKSSQVLEPEHKVVTLRNDGKNHYDFFMPDTTGSHNFTKNYGGHPRSDVALINEQSNMKAAQYLLEQLQQYPDSANTAGMSDLDIMRQYKSKYCQAPAEQIRWFDEQIKSEIAKRESQKVVDSQNKIDFNPNDEPKSE